MSAAILETRTTGAPSGALDPDDALRAAWTEWQRLDQLAGTLGEMVDGFRNAKARQSAGALLAYLHRRLDSMQGQIFARVPRSAEDARYVRQIAETIGTEESEAQAIAAERRFHRLASTDTPARRTPA